MDKVVYLVASGNPGSLPSDEDLPKGWWVEGVDVRQGLLGKEVWFARLVGTAEAPARIMAKGSSFVRIMDKFYLPEEQDANVFVGLFDAIAAHYECIVDVGRNVRNIKFLLSKVREHLGSRDYVHCLDYGCGTGLVLEAAKEVWPSGSVQIVGVDASPAMRDIAMRKGLCVVSPEELGRFALGFFDCCIASYVLHGGFLESDVERISGALGRRGVFVGNLHHGNDTEIQRIEKMFLSVGLRLVDVQRSGEWMSNPVLVFKVV